MKKYLYEYCVGCGLCQSVNKAKLIEDVKGYYHPEEGDEEFLDAICPSGGTQLENMDFCDVWGKIKKVYYGWSKDDYVRNAASSGGALTEIASFLLEKGYVDAVLHTCMAEDDSTKTSICISTTRNELINRCGSRYAISHPLLNVASLDKKKKYAFIGKPCDVIALKNYMRENSAVRDLIPYTLSFFCAGLPSADAQEKLLHEMDCDGKVVDLRYRGNGWPGWTTAIESSGKVHQLDYDTSWGKILGRDIMKMCRFCLDGIGEMADIACCDAWYLTEDNTPDFSEAEGRNAIFCRTDVGHQIVKEASFAGYIKLSDFQDYTEKMKQMQPYQFDRRATMRDKIFAMRFCNKPVPKYTNDICLYSHGIGLKRSLKIFVGTIKRVIKGRI